MKKEQLFLYLITDRQWLLNRTLSEDVEIALKNGVTMVQLREKKLSGDALLKEALEIKALCKQYSVPFIVNDDVILAAKTDADGVHVGQSDMSVADARKILGSGKIIGATAKTVEQAKTAYGQGAADLGSGAVFGSTTKEDARPMSVELLNEICDSVPIPVVAIGGITGDNVLELKGSRISGVAVISGILGVADIGNAAKDFCNKLKYIV